MASMYEDLIDYLTAEGIGVKNVNLFGARVPASPDDVIVISEQPGPDPELTMGRLAVDIMNVSVLVRDTRTSEARAKAFEIRDAFIAFNYKTPLQRTLAGKEYKGIIPRSAPFPLGLDENNRSRWSSNYLVSKEP